MRIECEGELSSKLSTIWSSMRPGITICRILGLLPTIPGGNFFLRAVCCIHYVILFLLFVVFCILRDSFCLISASKSNQNIKSISIIVTWVLFEIILLCTAAYMRYNESEYKNIFRELVSDVPQLIQGIEIKIKKITLILCFLTFAAISLGIYSTFGNVFGTKIYQIGTDLCKMYKHMDEAYVTTLELLAVLSYRLLSLIKIQFCILFIYVVLPFLQAFDNLNISLEKYGSECIHRFCRQHKILCDLVMKANRLMSIPMTVVLTSFLIDCLSSTFAIVVLTHSGNMLALIPQMVILVLVCHFGQKLHDKVCELILCDRHYMHVQPKITYFVLAIIDISNF